MTRRRESQLVWRGTQVPWVAATLLVGSLGIAVAEWSHLSDPERVPMFAAAIMMAASLAAAAITAIFTYQASRRASITAELVQALHQVLGWSEASHGIIRASSWKSLDAKASRHGVAPQKVRMTYTPAASAAIKQQTVAARGRSSAPTLSEPSTDDAAGANPDWLRVIKDLLAETLGQPYKLSVDRRRWQLTAIPLSDADEPEEEPKAIQRLRAIMATLFENTATVTSYEMNSKGHITEFVVKHDISAKLIGTPRIHRIERVVTTVLPGRWRGDFDWMTDTVTFQLRPTLPKLVWPRVYPETAGNAAALAAYRSCKFVYAYDEDRKPISWEPRKVPHRLIIGPTGSGKTSTIHTFITQASRAHWAISIADRKNVEYKGFRDWPNVQMVATRIEDQIALIHYAWVLMKQRYESVETGAARIEDFPPVLLVLDEFTELVKDIAAWYIKLRGSRKPSEIKGWPKELPIEEEVGSILRLGRTARIHIIIGMQRPDVKYVEGENRDNLTGRQSLGRLGRQGADMLWGDYYTGTTIPPGLLGRGMAYDDHGDPVEVQNFFTPDPNKPDDLADSNANKVLKALRPTTTTHKRIVFDTPFDPHQDDDFTWTDYLEAPVWYATDRPDLDPMSPEYRFKPKASATDPTAATSALGPGLTPNVTPLRQSTTSGGSKTRRRDVEDDKWAGYGSPAPRAVDDLLIGDLVCVDPGHGVWAILEKEPEPDPIDPDAVMLSVRGEGDQFDLLTVPSEGTVVSRPLLDDDEESSAA